MNQNNKGKLKLLGIGMVIGIVGCLIFSFFTSPSEVTPSDKMEKLRERLETSQRIIQLQNMELERIKKQRTSFFVEKEKYKAELDSSMVLIKHLTEVNVDQSDVNEALQWIESQEDSLR